MDWPSKSDFKSMQIGYHDSSGFKKTKKQTYGVLWTILSGNVNLWLMG